MRFTEAKKLKPGDKVCYRQDITKKELSVIHIDVEDKDMFIRCSGDVLYHHTALAQIAILSDEETKMPEIVTIHVCPNGCKNTTFNTTAHIMQEWEVDALGNFQEVVSDCLEVDHGPDNGNIWSCSQCGSEAEMVECRKTEITVPNVVLDDLMEQMKQTYYVLVEANPKSGKPPRVFTINLSDPGLVECEVVQDDDGSPYILLGTNKVKI